MGMGKKIEIVVQVFSAPEAASAKNEYTVTDCPEDKVFPEGFLQKFADTALDAVEKSLQSAGAEENAEAEQKEND